jgi:hypothetical protein
MWATAPEIVVCWDSKAGTAGNSCFADAGYLCDINT